jgi:hypothetical protein
MRYLLDETFKVNLVQNTVAAASNEMRGKEAGFILDDDLETYWTTEESINSASIEIELSKEQTFNCAMLQENILEGQRIEKFHLEWWDSKNWNTFADGTTIGYKRLLRFPPITTSKIKIVIDECRTNPTLASFGLYLSPPEVKFEPDGGTFSDNISVKLISDTKNAKIYYTLDGGTSDENSLIYLDKVSLNETTTITAITTSDDGKRSLPVTAVFNKAKFDIELKTGFDNKYPGQGIYTVVDGVHGSTNFNDRRWLGYNGTDFEAVIDLGEVKVIRKISSSFLSNTESWIFLPGSVEFSISDDGKVFTPSKEIKNEIQERDKETFVHTFELDSLNLSGRYVHVKANNIKICPDWHKGAGDKAWLFVDEIVIE